MTRWKSGPERLLSRKVLVGDCWEYAGHRNAPGYGRIYAEGRHWYAHRYSYTLHKGEIPEGFQVDHLCVNPACFNPDHLEAVPPQVNVIRSSAPSAITARTGICQRGHKMTPENVYVRRGGKRRMCRACQRERSKATQARRIARRRAAARAEA